MGKLGEVKSGDFAKSGSLFQTFPKKYLISHASLQHCFDKSRSGLEKLRESDPSFPRPIKFGPSKQAGVYFVVAEVEAWLESKISERDGITRALSERDEQ
ncbi:helix-turn-helix transcriptional regulator [Pseudomonas aeruginosa]|uniref:helix-turn-helix transcriptional regulator n=1 Tax=Pseudomonas aeruginosa TaxID=287 RepID=UPI0035590927